jgi:hypothetical protein
LGEFSPYGRWFTLGSLSKIAELALMFGLLDSAEKNDAYVLKQEMGWATFWAIFFANSSGHPALLLPASVRIYLAVYAAPIVGVAKCGRIRAIFFSPKNPRWRKVHARLAANRKDVANFVRLVR